MRSDLPRRARSPRGLALLLALLLPLPALAWWHDDWSTRQQVTITAPGGDASAGDLPVLVRLHTGNFPFLDARPDGADLRVIAEDDRTPVAFRIDSYDSVNELAAVWVRVSAWGAGGKASLRFYAGNPKAPQAGEGASPFDGATALVLHLGESDGMARDASTFTHAAAASVAKPADGGVIGGASHLVPGAVIRFDAGRGLAFDRGEATLTAWVRAGSGSSRATLATLAGEESELWVGLEQGRLVARRGAARVQAATPFEVGTWHWVAVTAGDQLRLIVDGVEAGAAAMPKAPLRAPFVLGGEGFEGDLDEVTLAGAVRSPAWLRTVHASQAAGGGIANVEAPETTRGGGHSYFGILIAAVTPDGWIVIGVLVVLALAAVGVMLDRLRTLLATDAADARFLTAFDAGRERFLDPAHLADAPDFGESALAELWRTGLREVARRRPAGRGNVPPVDALAVASIRAAVESTLAREAARLNRRMVLLTIAISGGPFLGLLGTVTGVMITFAAIAAAGDVNINAIAPGVAAALVATVAGLVVAIPALFAYNWLSTRITATTTRMEGFAGELVAQLAETHGRGGAA